VRGDIFRTRTDRPWCASSLLSDTNSLSLTGVKRSGRGVNQPSLFSAGVKEKVELYLLLLPWAFMTCSRTNFTFTFTNKIKCSEERLEECSTTAKILELRSNDSNHARTASTSHESTLRITPVDLATAICSVHKSENYRCGWGRQIVPKRRFQTTSRRVTTQKTRGRVHFNRGGSLT
jgi:hypothetical protein